MFPDTPQRVVEDEPAPVAARALILRIAAERWRVIGVPGSEVAPCPPAVRIPGAPAWLAGMVVHKGEAMALVDPGVLLGSEPEPTAQARARIFITRAAGFAVAFAVDDVDEDRGAEVSGDLDAMALARDLLNRAQVADS